MSSEIIPLNVDHHESACLEAAQRTLENHPRRSSAVTCDLNRLVGVGKKDGICGELRSHRAAFVGVKGVIWGDGGGNIRVARRWGAIRFLQLVFIELFFGLRI